MLKTHGESLGQEQAFDDLIQNHFELKSYQDIGVRRDVGKNTISSNVQRALKTIHKKALSGSFWEGAIFSWMLEHLEKISRENNLVLDTIVDGQVVDAFPSRDTQSFFALMVRPYSSPAYSSEQLLQLVQSFSANPLLAFFLILPSLLFLTYSSSGLGGRVLLISFFWPLVQDRSLFSMLKSVIRPTSSMVLILLILSAMRFLFLNRSL